MERYSTVGGGGLNSSSTSALKTKEANSLLFAIPICCHANRLLEQASLSAGECYFMRPNSDL